MALVAAGVGGVALLTGAKWYFGRAAWEMVAPAELELGPRSLHAAAVDRDRETMYMVGGRHEEHYMRDAMALDLKTLMWSALPSFPVSCAGHSLVATERGLIALVGIPSDGLLRAYKLDTGGWLALKTAGHIPRATRGHSATVIGNQVWVVGGEDFKGDLYDSVHRLHLDNWRWEPINASGSIPCPRSFHGAALHRDRDLYIFGGRMKTSTGGGLYRLDTAKMEWSCRKEVDVSKAFFGSTVVGDKCYVVGGRDPATRTTPDTTLALDMRVLGWTVPFVDPPLQLEGLSLVHAVTQGRDTLIACGSDCTP